MPERVKSRYNPIAVDLRLYACCNRCALDFLPVFVSPSNQEDLTVLEPLPSGDRIGSHRSVSMTDVRNIIDVI